MTNAGTPSNAFDDAVQDILDLIGPGHPDGNIGIGPKFDDPDAAHPGGTLYLSTLTTLMTGLISPTTHVWAPGDRQSGMAAIGQLMTTFIAGDEENFLRYKIDDLKVLSAELVRLRDLKVRE